MSNLIYITLPFILYYFAIYIYITSPFILYYFGMWNKQKNSAYQIA